MGRDPNHPYRDLIDHPVQQIDSFLLNFDLEDDWVGILGGPVIERPTDDITLEYNVRLLDGPYDSQYSAELTYRFDAADMAEQVVLVDVYLQQVDAIEMAFPDATVRCYEPSSWAESDRG